MWVVKWKLFHHLLFQAVQSLYNYLIVSNKLRLKFNHGTARKTSHLNRWEKAPWQGKGEGEKKQASINVITRARVIQISRCSSNLMAHFWCAFKSMRPPAEQGFDFESFMWFHLLIFGLLKTTEHQTLTYYLIIKVIFRIRSQSLHRGKLLVPGDCYKEVVILSKTMMFFLGGAETVFGVLI